MIRSMAPGNGGKTAERNDVNTHKFFAARPCMLSSNQLTCISSPNSRMETPPKLTLAPYDESDEEKLIMLLQDHDLKL